MDKGKVSILVNCYNGEQYLKQSLDSIVNQTYENWEILFVDNCSTDRSAEIALSYGEKVTYIKTPENYKLYKARNFGLEKASGEFLAFLDSDDTWEAQKLENQIKAFNENKDLKFIFTDSKVIYQDLPIFKIALISIYHLFFKILSNLRGSRFYSIDEILKNYRINMQTVILKRRFLNGLVFNEKLNLPGDFDFFIKYLLKNNVKPYYLPYITASTRLHRNQLSRKSKFNWLVETQYVFMCLKKNGYSNFNEKAFKCFLARYKAIYYSSKGKMLLSLKGLLYNICFPNAILFIRIFFRLPINFFKNR